MRIKILLRNSQHKDKRGIYRINFGQAFYIGCAYNIGQRMAKHQCGINSALEGRRWIGRQAAHKDIAEYIKAHPEIQTAVASMLEEHIPGEGSIFDLESVWLDFLTPNPLCFNKYKRK